MTAGDLVDAEAVAGHVLLETRDIRPASEIDAAYRMYEPGAFVDRVSPTPLLMIVGKQDTVTLTDTALAAYNRALHPKELVMLSGGHFRGAKLP
ncbi:hypothetical protein ACFYTG_54180 [Streptomyces mirabilis]|uniref:hypothetical protein n=1 Tax=Streptomyces mirabilis TaxID=68239 RepID=UPI0036A48A88